MILLNNKDSHNKWSKAKYIQEASAYIDLGQMEINRKN